MATDVKRLKASLDLAKLNHASFQTEDTKATLEAAQSAYEAALSTAVTDTKGGIVDEPADDKSRKESAAKPVKPAAKASTAKDGDGGQSADTDKDDESEKKSGVPSSE